MLVVFLILVIPAAFLIPEASPSAVQLPLLNQALRHVWPLPIAIAVAFIIGTLLAPLLFQFFVMDQYRELLLPFRLMFGSKRHIVAILLSVLAGLAFVLTAWIYQDKGFEPFILTGPGGLFALVTGILSVVGVYLTLHAVLDVRNSILSFNDFIRRTLDLVHSTGDSDYVRMMLHTPATGCLTLPHETWTRLATCITSRQQRFSLTCLSQDAMLEWFESYKAGLEGPILKDMELRIQRGLHESQMIKEAVRNPAKPASEDERHSGISSVVEACWENLPQYYLISNRDRAIVAIPFFLPRPGTNIFTAALRTNVQMIGFETSNPDIVEAVHREISVNRAHAEEKAQRGVAAAESNALKGENASPD